MKMKFDTSLLNSIPILEVAHKLGISVKKKKAMCFNGHDSKTPSLSFDIKGNLWHCFGCNDSGNNIMLVMRVLNRDFVSSCLWLKETFIIGSPNDGYQKREIIKYQDQRVEIRKNENRCDPEVYSWIIRETSLTANAINYLVNHRGFSKETLEKLNIRCIDKPSEFFIKAREKWGISRLVKCGLAKESGNNSVTFLWWDETIIFPFYDQLDNIIYLQGRRIGDKEPKYINLLGVETPIYNLSILKCLKKNQKIFICEGIPDTIAAIEKGLNSVGILGANNFKDKWVEIFTDYIVVVIPDNDKAGDKFVHDLEKLFEQRRKAIQVAHIPPKYKDYADYMYHLKRG